MSGEVLLTWLGHSCFRMEYEGFSLVTDPYSDGSVPGLPPLRQSADAVYCSHFHGDHGFTEAVTLTGGRAPADFSVAEAACPHDDCGGSKRGMNTVRVFSFGGIRIAHMGAVGCIPDRDVLDLIRGCDVLILPVGGYYTVDAAQAAEIAALAAPRCVVPCHYREGKRGFDVLGGVAEFTKRFDAVAAAGSTLTVTADAPRGVVVMSL